jgi:hypothetical protein
VPEEAVSGGEPALDGYDSNDLVRIRGVRDDRFEFHRTAPHPQETGIEESQLHLRRFQLGELFLRIRRIARVGVDLQHPLELLPSQCRLAAFRIRHPEMIVNVRVVGRLTSFLQFESFLKKADR